ncbi:MAG: hypothetical protein MI924_26455 [Chloroflexales bacterium]|nr:hypothetical protein [Chloroflexales bacterium]
MMVSDTGWRYWSGLVWPENHLTVRRYGVTAIVWFGVAGTAGDGDPAPHCGVGMAWRCLTFP